MDCTPGCILAEIVHNHMDNIAPVIHPVDPRQDVAGKYPLLGKAVPTAVIHLLSRFWPPVLSRGTGVHSATTGKKIEGWLVACPLSDRRR